VFYCITVLVCISPSHRELVLLVANKLLGVDLGCVILGPVFWLYADNQELSNTALTYFNRYKSMLYYPHISVCEIFSDYELYVRMMF